MLARFVRCISGTVVTSSSSLYCRSVYNLVGRKKKHLLFENHQEVKASLVFWTLSIVTIISHETVHCLRFIMQHFENCVCLVLFKPFISVTRVNYIVSYEERNQLSQVIRILAGSHPKTPQGLL